MNRMPLVRHLYGWNGVVDASSLSLSHEAKDYNISIIAGGIAEMYFAGREREREREREKENVREIGKEEEIKEKEKGKGEREMEREGERDKAKGREVENEGDREGKIERVKDKDTQREKRTKKEKREKEREKERENKIENKRERKRETEKIFLKTRKGFIRFALRERMEIVPVYHFGNSSLFFVLSPFSSLLQSLSRSLRACILFFYGRWGLPIPFRQVIVSVVGKPLSLSPLLEKEKQRKKEREGEKDKEKKNEIEEEKERERENEIQNIEGEKMSEREKERERERERDPSPELVDEVHSLFLSEVTSLYNNYRHLIGWEDKDLEIR